MGSDYSTAGGSKPADVLNQYKGKLPGIMNEVSGLIPDVANQQLIAANRQVNPGSKDTLGFNALNLDQLQKYALPEAKVGQEVINSNALAGARTNLEQIKGPGGDAARAGMALTNELNPALGAANRGATSALGAINLNGLSPGEFNATERALNQSNSTTGNLGLNNPMNIVNNAMNFGGAFNSKLGLLDKATNTANTVAGTTNTAFNPSSFALGQPNPSTATNLGSGQFNNTSPISSAGAAANTFNFGSGLLSTMGSMNTGAQAAGAQMAGQTSPSAYLNSSLGNL